MRLERRDGYRVLVGGPVPPQAEAITLGRLIVVRRRSEHSRALLSHELVHVRQFVELGPLRFLARYLGSYVRHRLGGHGHMAAYRRIPLEVEASWLSRVHSTAALEPGGGEPGPATVSQVRSPRPVVAQRLHDEAERISREAGRVSPAAGSWAASAGEPHAARRARRASTSRRRKRTAPPTR